MPLPLLPLAITAASAGASYLASKKQAKAAGKQGLPKSYKERKRLKKLNKFLMKNLKKYGGEAFVQKGALSPEQKNIMSLLTQGISGQAPKSALDNIMKGQQGLGLNQGLPGNLMDMLQGGNEAYQRFAQPFQQQYERNVGDLANRFGGLGALSSSGFAQSLGGAAGDLSAQLGSLKAGLQQNALDRQLRASGLALGTPTQHTAYRAPTLSTGMMGGGFGGGAPQAPGALSQFFTAAAPGVGQAVGKYGIEKLGDLFNSFGAAKPVV